MNFEPQPSICVDLQPDQDWLVCNHMIISPIVIRLNRTAFYPVLSFGIMLCGCLPSSPSLPGCGVYRLSPRTDQTQNCTRESSNLQLMFWALVLTALLHRLWLSGALLVWYARSCCILIEALPGLAPHLRRRRRRRIRRFLVFHQLYQRFGHPHSVEFSLLSITVTVAPWSVCSLLIMLFRELILWWSWSIWYDIIFSYDLKTSPIIPPAEINFSLMNSLVAMFPTGLIFFK